MAAKESPLPRSEWPKSGGVSEASAFGWQEEDDKYQKHTWWDRLDVTTFTAKVISLDVDRLFELYDELSANIASINIQLLNNDRRQDDEWFDRARSAVLHVAAKRKVVGRHLAMATANGNKTVRKRARQSLLMVSLQESKELFPSDPAQAFERLVAGLEKYFGPED
jgi:hypothetical protein